MSHPEASLSIIILEEMEKEIRAAERARIREAVNALRFGFVEGNKILDRESVLSLLTDQNTDEA